MNKLGDALIAFRDISLNTKNKDVCAVSSIDVTEGSKQCTFGNTSDVDCDFCILDRKAKLDKGISILNKLE